MQSRYLGVDLSGPVWRVAAVHDWQADGPKLVPLTTRLTPGGASPLDANARELAVVASALQAGKENAIDEQLKGLFAPSYDAYGRGVASHHKEKCDGALVAVCIPYRTPPIVRRRLPGVFGQEPLKIAGHKAPRDLALVEAPLALALQAVVSGECGPGDSLLWLTPAPDPAAVELTAAVLSLHGTTLRFQALRSAEFAPGTAEAEAVLRAFDAALPAPRSAWAVCHAGADTKAEADRIKAELRIGRVIGLDADALARGAIQYAGRSRDKAEWLLGKDMAEFEADLVAPAAIGVLGTNGAGDEWYWRRLVAPGDPLPCSATVVTPETVVPKDLRYLALAECGNPQYAGRFGIHESEWAGARIRWHEYLRPNPAGAPDRPHEWTFTWENRKWTHPWHIPRWTCAARPLNPADSAGAEPPPR